MESVTDSRLIQLAERDLRRQPELINPDGPVEVKFPDGTFSQVAKVIDRYGRATKVEYSDWTSGSLVMAIGYFNRFGELIGYNGNYLGFRKLFNVD
jgi:hypothetical protein